MLQARPQRSEDNVKSKTPAMNQAAPVPIGERAGSEDQRGEAERIGVHDPLQARQAGIKRCCMLGNATTTTVMSSRA